VIETDSIIENKQERERWEEYRKKHPLKKLDREKMNQIIRMSKDEEPLHEIKEETNCSWETIHSVRIYGRRRGLI
jgi:RNase adaptor protein for sRNA GlmZ degradation